MGNPIRNVVQSMLVLLLGIAGATAAGISDQDSQRRIAVEVIHAYVVSLLGGIGGTAQINVGSIDAQLPPASQCPSFEAFATPSVRLPGSASIGLRCNGGRSWMIFVPVTARVQIQAVVATRPLPQGHVLVNGDATLKTIEVGSEFASIPTELSEIEGKMLGAPIAPDQVIRRDLLKTQLAVAAGQSVRILAQGRGFAVSGDGKAMGNANEGQPVQVRGSSGQLISGTARRGGLVEIEIR